MARLARAGTQIGDGVNAPFSIAGPVVIDAALELNGAIAGGTSLGQGTSGAGSLTILGGMAITGGLPLAHTGATTVLGGGVLGGPLPGGGALTIAAGGQVDSATVVAASLSGGGTLNFGTLDVGDWNAVIRRSFGPFVDPSTPEAQWIVRDAVPALVDALAESHVAFALRYDNEGEDPGELSRWYDFIAADDVGAWAPRLVIRYYAP